MLKRSRFLQVLAVVSALGLPAMGQDKPLMKTGAELEKESPTVEKSLVGKKLWFVPNTKLPRGARYGFSTTTAIIVRDEDKLFPERSLSMEVVSDEGGLIGHYQVRLPDGSMIEPFLIRSIASSMAANGTRNHSRDIRCWWPQRPPLRWGPDLRSPRIVQSTLSQNR